MPLCHVGSPGCGCPGKKRLVTNCFTVAIPDKKGNPIAYESCRDSCVRSMVGGMPLAIFPGGPLEGARRPRYAGGPLDAGRSIAYPGGPLA